MPRSRSRDGGSSTIEFARLSNEISRSDNYGTNELYVGQKADIEASVDSRSERSRPVPNGILMERDFHQSSTPA